MPKIVAPYVLKNVGQCLYRNGHGTYFALLRVNGKQIKRSLKTTNPALAKRRLSELRSSAKGLAGEDRAILFEHLVSRWMTVKKTDLRPQSYKRLISITRMLSGFLGGMPVRSIGLPATI